MKPFVPLAMLCVSLLLPNGSATAQQEPPQRAAGQRPAINASREKIARSLKAPDGFDLRVFAAPLRPW